MKAFLEEYGLVIVIVVVIAALIILAQAVSKKGADAVGKTTDSLFTAGKSAADAANNAVTDKNMGEIGDAVGSLPTS